MRPDGQPIASALKEFGCGELTSSARFAVLRYLRYLLLEQLPDLG